MFKFITRLFEKKYESLNGVAFKERWRKAGTNVVLIDVRTPSEFKSGTIPGSQNLDIMSGKFKNAVLKMDQSKEYFLFCRSGARSGTAAGILADAGLKVVNLSGGIGSWNSAK